MARPSSYTAEIADVICTRLAAGESLRAICRDEGMPDEATVRRWAWDERLAPGFPPQYARARELGYDAMAEHALEIADVCREGRKTERKQVGWVCPACDKEAKWRGNQWQHAFPDETTPVALCVAKPERVYEEKVVTADMVERARLQVDTRKWLLAKMAPKRYGDKVQQEITGPEGGPVKASVTVEFVKAAEQR